MNRKIALSAKIINLLEQDNKYPNDAYLLFDIKKDKVHRSHGYTRNKQYFAARGYTNIILTDEQIEHLQALYRLCNHLPTALTAIGHRLFI